jgi:hypothetical protein
MFHDVPAPPKEFIKELELHIPVNPPLATWTMLNLIDFGLELKH